MRSRRTAFALALVLALVVVPTFSACGTPATIVTEPGKAAYKADQVILRLTEISAFVKASTGAQPGNISYRDGFTIIEWISGDANATPPTTGLAQIVAATPGQTWKATAKQGWTTRIRPLFLTYPKLAPYADVVDALLEVI
jgi:hypothetical protein